MKLSLRLKVTFINTIVLIICSVLLTVSTYFSAARTIDSLENIPSTNTPINIEKNNIENKDSIPAQNATSAFTIEKEKLITKSTLYMFLVIGLGCVITYLATSKSLESVKRLNEDIKDINEHNLSKKIKEDGPEDEIKDLTKSFNKMLSRIDDAFESQKEFSMNVAHELRTPLAVIKMKIDVFKKRKEHTKDDYENLLEIIEKNNNRLSKVVEELLSICNMDSIEFKDEINLNNLIKSIINDLKYIAFEKNITIDLNNYIDENESINLYGSEDLLYRAIYNLIENSIKYNYENGYVKIDLSKDCDFVNITIKDSGIGIKEEDYENIFKPFFRVDKSRSRKVGGSGLGLSIVKNIISKHGGSIEVLSCEKGSEFIVKIPLN
ncbi:sensor histidine kinase [Paraclostridium dentum]|uniref:sensor histidine kinase n=1 Tax=Paraclostridium dentum TaxID=2662455 RepID=UPI003AFFB708